MVGGESRCAVFLAEIYRECESRGVPVMFHTGTSIFPKARNVFADPMPVDDVAVDFPRLKIILGKSGCNRQVDLVRLALSVPPV